MKPAALFVRADSVYRRLGADCWDAERDATRYSGPAPIVAHPPCRAWGRYHHWAKPKPGERELSPMAVRMVRTFGGVLEHPRASRLWKLAGMPRPGEFDAFGGWVLDVEQGDFGHRAPKPTRCYIVGCEPDEVPALPAQRALAFGRVELMGVREREATPEPFARWLLDLARVCARH